MVRLSFVVRRHRGLVLCGHLARLSDSSINLFLHELCRCIINQLLKVIECLWLLVG